MDIELAQAYGQNEAIKALFAEYTDLLVAGDSAFKEYLALQKYDDELDHPEEKYGLPWGRLYLACRDGLPVGCIALRKIDDKSCEMKRLYVRPSFRGNGIGRRLVEKIIADAKEIGYKHILLDTLPFLTTAIQMYREFGFYEIPRYNNSPLDTTIYMKLDL